MLLLIPIDIGFECLRSFGISCISRYRVFALQRQVERHDICKTGIDPLPNIRRKCVHRVANKSNATGTVIITNAHAW